MLAGAGESTAAPARYDATALMEFGAALLRGAGMESAAASVVARICVEGDMLNHTTHGIRLLTGQLALLRSGGMAKVRSSGPRIHPVRCRDRLRCCGVSSPMQGGEPVVLADSGAAVNWDGGETPLNGL